jgi:ABC-type dipeptide/oligopeptide/nickel transport system permease component
MNLKMRTRWKGSSPWPMLIALVASVPAFYDSMMPTPATWATWMYLVSGTVVVWTTWQARRARLVVFQAIANRDLVVVRDVVLLLVAMVVFFNFVVDVLYAVIDPSLKTSDA